MKRILAIDPGINGGIAWNDITGTRFFCAPMPATETEIVEFLKQRRTEAQTVFIEKVSGFAGVSRTGAAMFSFGENFGFIKGVLTTLGFQGILVTPQRWQKELSLGTKKEFNYETILTKGKNKGKPVVKSNWKQHLLEEAQQLYPNNQITLKTADAMLILHYGLKYLYEK